MCVQRDVLITSGKDGHGIDNKDICVNTHQLCCIRTQCGLGSHLQSHHKYMVSAPQTLAGSGQT